MQGGDFNPEHPQLGQAWYWTEQTGGVYLGLAPDGGHTSPYYAADVSADGSLIVGNYLAELAGGQWAGRSFIWTEATGMTAIGQILPEHELDDDQWAEQNALRVSSRGDLILLIGVRYDDTPRAALLRLIPRGLDE